MSTQSMRSELQSEVALLPSAEEALVRAAQSGDIKAFSTLVERHQGLARAVAFSVCGDYSVTEDLAQEAMVTAWLRLSDLSNPAKFRPWLATIVRNTTRYWRRHQGRHAPRAQYGEEVLALLPDDNQSPLDLAVHKEDHRHAHQALEGLSARYKEPLLLYYCLGESHAEVASALGVSEAAVRQRLCRARKKLKQDVSSLERSGTRLRNQASAAAAVVLVIHSRQAWAHTAARVGTPSTLASPKIFMGLGALAGAALVACVAAVVLIVAGNDSAQATSGVAAELPKTMAAEEPSTTISTTPARDGDHSEADLLDSRALVRIGNGRVKDKSIDTSATRSDGQMDRGRVANRRVEDESSGNAAGRIKKHGPARLDEEALTDQPKPLLRPSLDMKAVRRELWSD